MALSRALSSPHYLSGNTPSHCVDCGSSVICWQLTCFRVNQGHSDFSSFSDIRNPGSYTAPYGSLLLQGKEQSDTATFNFNEFWKFGEGETMEEPFDLCNEVVEGLLHALGIVCNLH
jgi:hypothetical protein